MTETKQLTISLLPEEHQELLRRAQQDGISAVEWVLHAIGVYARLRDAGLLVVAR